jgi:hypothetical protein
MIQLNPANIRIAPHAFFLLFSKDRHLLMSVGWEAQPPTFSPSPASNGGRDIYSNGPSVQASLSCLIGSYSHHPCQESDISCDRYVKIYFQVVASLLIMLMRS